LPRYVFPMITWHSKKYYINSDSRAKKGQRPWPPQPSREPKGQLNTAKIQFLPWNLLPRNLWSSQMLVLLCFLEDSSLTHTAKDVPEPSDKRVCFQGRLRGDGQWNLWPRGKCAANCDHEIYTWNRTMRFFNYYANIYFRNINERKPITFRPWWACTQHPHLLLQCQIALLWNDFHQVMNEEQTADNLKNICLK